MLLTSPVLHVNSSCRPVHVHHSLRVCATSNQVIFPYRLVEIRCGALSRATQSSTPSRFMCRYITRILIDALVAMLHSPSSRCSSQLHRRRHGFAGFVLGERAARRHLSTSHDPGPYERPDTPTVSSPSTHFLALFLLHSHNTGRNGE